ncbi:TPA: hypothetical protein N0F65_000715 [Lagenidium giganteum]|uniref:RWP-RK domain-containing protein n=1 Tax=Lagenidium giganteum TaxID=4803 RepID=A0AAV2ZJH9_9STRA|nr:TPA: hypothetical protein N0F65_000715 [Lagenidium giganteum]
MKAQAGDGTTGVSPTQQQQQQPALSVATEGMAQDAAPVSPTLVKDMMFDPRYLSEAWVQESPRHVYAMLAPPPAIDTFGQHPPSPTPALHLQQQHMDHQQQQLHLHQLQQQQSLGLVSPVAGMHPFYSHATTMLTSPHHAQGGMQAAFPGAFAMGQPSLTVDVMDSLGTGTHTDALGNAIPQQSPTHMLKTMMTPMTPRSPVVSVKDLTLNELRPHFNKPMAVVAKELGVCITLMKKICRRNGLVRWPHRRIRSLVNRITSLQVIASSSSGSERRRFQSQIIALREELSAVIQNPNEKSRKAQADAKARSPMASDVKREPDDVEAMDADEDDEEEDDLAAPSGSGDGDQVQQDVSGEQDVSVSSVKAEVPSPNSTKRKDVLLPPPPIKIPRLDEQDATSLSRRTPHSVGSRGSDSDNERPSSTTSTGSKRGSISSILCDSFE